MTGEPGNHPPPVRACVVGEAVPSEWTGWTCEFPTDRTVVDWFQEMVRQQPDRPAVQEGSRRMTYRELDCCANRIAHELLRRGLKPEETVAVYLSASCEFLAAILGVLKAGGTYFPVATDIPDKRLEYLLTDSQSRYVLSDLAGIRRLPKWSGKVLETAGIMQPAGNEWDRAPQIPADPGRRAYITYTSGSTGQPKGVEIEHRALTNFVFCCQRRFAITARDRAAMLAYVSFDASVGDIWPALCAGGTLVIPPEGILLKPDGLVEWLTAEQLTLAFVSTGLVEIIMPRPWPQNMALRYMITGGDRLRVRPTAGLTFALINGYGPTENTVFSTWSEVLPEDGSKQAPLIGRPLANTTAYVLDENLRPVPVGEAGELYVGGAQVARGYLGQPELTRQKFVPDPFSTAPGARMYRTGDWTRWLPTGEIDFIGRKDGQIQIRGRRVELGEIEAAISAHAAVRQICCVPWLDDGMPAAVIAHIVPQNGDGDLAGELRAYLQPLIPDYMVPSKFVTHETLPLTPQGKLDRAALIALQSAAKPVPAEITGAGTELEQKLARLWHTLLPAAASSSQDATFQMLGGDSLLAIKLLLGVEEIIGRQLELSAFLLRPTFAGLCQMVKARLAQNEFQPVLALRTQGRRPPLFILYGHTGDVEQGMSLAQALGDDQPVYGIRSPVLADNKKLPLSIEAAATEAIRFIRTVQPHGAPALVGYSWAGMLAFEIARQLLESEKQICFAVLIGTHAPAPSLNRADRAWHLVRHFPAWLGALITDRENRRRRLARWRGMLTGTTHTLTRPYTEKFEMPDWVSSPVSFHMINLMNDYRPQSRPDLCIEVIRELDEYRPPLHPLHPEQISSLSDAGWKHWTRRPNHVHWLPGNHVTILQPPLVEELARTIRAAHDRFLQG